MSKLTVYIAGKITGDEDYKSKFARAEQMLRESGYIPVNPAWLPSEGFTYEAYMRISRAMLDECDAVFLLSDWAESSGAVSEWRRAASADKSVLMLYDGQLVVI